MGQSRLIQLLAVIVVVQMVLITVLVVALLLLVGDRQSVREIAAVPTLIDSSSDTAPLQTNTDSPELSPTPVPSLTPTKTLVPTDLPTLIPVPSPTPTDTPTPTTAPPSPIVALPFRVIDAEYSLALDRIIMVSENPHQLHIYNPEAPHDDRTVDLPRTPLNVSVGPDGLFAAVGHDALVSYVNLGTGELVKTLDISTEAFDTVLAGNGWIYVSPARDQWETLRAVEIETNKEVLSGSMRAGTVYKLHPGGQSLYGADRGLSPSDIEKFDISAGVPERIGDSPYHGTHRFCGNLWMSADGLRIFTACGNVFRAANDREQDMTYNGSLDGADFLTHLVHAPTTRLVLGVTGRGEFGNRLIFWNYDSLGWQETILLPDFIANNLPFAANGQFVFVNRDETNYYVLVQADAESGLLNDFGIYVGKLG